PLRTKALAATAADVPGVEEVTYGAQVTDRLLALTRGVRVLAALVTVFLTGVALIVVVNTIRLTVIARRREIEIMQLVGATRWFIQWPLLLEGILEGTAAAAMATALLTGLYTLSAAAVRRATTGPRNRTSERCATSESTTGKRSAGRRLSPRNCSRTRNT